MMRFQNRLINCVAHKNDITLLPLASLFCARSFATSSSAAPNPKLYTIDANKLTTDQCSKPREKYADKTKLIFGKEFSDHMLEVPWDQNTGWAAPKICPYHDICLPPSASVFHYALECFEGMKAYKDANNKIRLFRPMENMRRLNRSGDRLRLPSFNEEGLLSCISKLVLIDKDWIPSGKGYSMYIRPTLISTQKTLGVGPASTALLFVITSPVGPYYPSGFKPVKLLADEMHVRAWPGGTGGFKLGSNYAPTIAPQTEAAAKGFSQILWLFNDYVTEVGTMNMFVLWKNKQGEKELVTPPLADGTILPGVTRDSILSLTREWKEFKVSERSFTIHEVMEAADQGRLLEAFGAGTAAIVSPIESITYRGKAIQVPVDPSIGSGQLAKRLMDHIMAIQYGEINHEWSVVIG